MFLFNHERTITTADLTKEIRTDRIKSTKMSKIQYSKIGDGAFIDWLDVHLNEVEIGNIAGWINSVSEADMTKLEHMPARTSISAGIVFNLRGRKEIRIQYDLERIYITRTDIKDRSVLYSIHQEELKAFFDNQLKGFYFGKDRVN